MATGDTLAECSVLGSDPPATAYATLSTRNAQPVLEFDATVRETTTWAGVLPAHYQGGPLQVHIAWCAATATAGAVVWQAALERQQAGVTDLDTDSFAALVSATAAAPAASGVLTVTVLTLSGATTDGVQASERYRLQVARDATQAADTMTGDAQIVAVWLREG